MKSSFFRHVFLTLIVALAISASAHADVAGAKKAADDAKKNVADKDWASADTNIKLAEAELDGVAAADKAPITKDLDGLKKQIADAKGSEAKQAIVKQADSLIADAKQYLTNDASGVLRAADAMDELLKRDDTKAAISADDITKYAEQMAKYRKVAQGKSLDQEIENITRETDRLEQDFAAKMAVIKSPDSPAARDEAVNSLGRDLEILAKHLAAQPADNDKVKALQARYAKMNTPYAAAALGGQAKQKLETLKSSWDSYAEEFKGWETETAGPTFDQFSHESSEKISAFNAPKSKALINRADQFMDNRNDDADYKAVAAAPEVKAFVDSIAKMRADAYAKMLKLVTAVVEQAEKAKIDDNNKTAVSRLKDDIRLALGEKAPDTKPLQDRVDKLLTGYEAATTGAQQAKEDAYKKLKEQAGKAWPDMAAKFSASSGFDPKNYKDFKGKTIKITTDNLMGYRFKPGDFAFATTLNGIPIAGRFDPVVKAAVADVETKIGRGLGDSDDDGKWEVFATVDGITGRMMARKQVEGDLKVDGEKVGTYTGEYAEPVDAPIITIIAAHCGPLAVAAGQGAVTESGAVAAPAGVVGASGSSASASGGWGLRILFLLIGLTAAAACLLKAGFAPVASIPQVGEAQAKIGGSNLAYIGLACAAWGVLWLLIGLIYRGFLVNAAIIAAGSYAALDLLAAKGIVKPEQVAKIKPLGVPIGLACAAAVILSLLLGILGMNLVIL